MNLVELQNKIHAQNKELGWWDEPRPFSTFICLFHSELSEAVEGDRKGLMDDHLPQYPMFQVELADFVIRCMDYLGFVGNSIGYSKMLTIKSEATETELVANLHRTISESYSLHRDGLIACSRDELVDAVNVCHGFSNSKGFDLDRIILDKLEYNKHRADHKRENRAKQGGKKY
jgi:hypothetical protein